ncbi:hypothetical protein MIDIC_140029 [Alphaproteobacteria bacterium]
MLNIFHKPICQINAGIARVVQDVRDIVHLAYSKDFREITLKRIEDGEV